MKIKYRISEGIVCVIFTVVLLLMIPLLLLWLLWELIYTPVGYIKFKRSLHQKDFPRKYQWMRRPHVDNDVYTVIKEHGLPIAYFKCPEDDELPGYFLYQDMFFCFSEPFFFDKQRELWLFWPHSRDENDEEHEEPFDSDEAENTEDCLTVEQTKAYCIEELRARIPDCICNDVVFFYQSKATEKLYGAAAVEQMRAMEGFVLYKKGELQEALTAYIEQHSRLLHF